MYVPTEKKFYMIRRKNLSIPLLICFFFSSIFWQRKFPAPPSADATINPLKGNADATTEGKRTYTMYCVPCHGSKGKGDGIAAPGLAKPPADHTSDFVQKQKDGAIFWVITEGNNPMPTYKTTLTEMQRWQLVNYIRTLAKTKK